MHSGNVTSKHVDRENVLTRVLVLQVDILSAKAQVHSDLILALLCRVDQWIHSITRAVVDIGTMITEHFDRPLFVVIHCLKEWRKVTEFALLKENFRILLQKKLSQFAIIIDGRLREGVLTVLCHMVDIGSRIYHRCCNLEGVLVMRADNESGNPAIHQLVERKPGFYQHLCNFVVFPLNGNVQGIGLRAFRYV